MSDVTPLAEAGDQRPLSKTKKLDKFTLFLNLPIEIRLLIWRKCFPRARHVNFHPTKVHDDRCWVGAGKSSISSSHQALHGFTANVETFADPRVPNIWNNLPVTISVSKESRAETLNHYYLFFPSAFKSFPPLDIGDISRADPICVNPTIDTVYLSADFCLRDRWLEYLHQKSPFSFSLIRALEIRELPALKWDLIHYILSSLIVNRLPSAGGSWFSKIILFSGLKTLKFTCRRSPYEDMEDFAYLCSRYIMREDMKGCANRWLKFNDAAFVDNTPPEFLLWDFDYVSPFAISTQGR